MIRTPTHTETQHSLGQTFTASHMNFPQQKRSSKRSLSKSKGRKQHPRVIRLSTVKEWHPRKNATIRYHEQDDRSRKWIIDEGNKQSSSIDQKFAVKSSSWRSAANRNEELPRGERGAPTLVKEEKLGRDRERERGSLVSTRKEMWKRVDGDIKRLDALHVSDVFPFFFSFFFLFGDTSPMLSPNFFSTFN